MSEKKRDKGFTIEEFDEADQEALRNPPTEEEERHYENEIEPQILKMARESGLVNKDFVASERQSSKSLEQSRSSGFSAFLLRVRQALHL